jgi:hypothetical protein
LPIFDPYANHGPNLANAAREIFAITPHATNDLPKACKALRVVNKEATWATLAIVTIDGSTVTLDIPPNCLWTEPTIVAKVLVAGTTATLVIHGYTD